MTEPQIHGSVLYYADQLVAEFVRVRIPHLRNQTFGKCTALGVVRRNLTGGDPILVGGVVFTNARMNSQGAVYDIEMSGAFDDGTWCKPSTLRRLFSYPFIDLKCVRLTTTTAKKNKRARRLDVALGFVLEGIGRKALDGVNDAAVYSMLREECWWIDRSATRPPIFDQMMKKRGPAVKED